MQYIGNICGYRSSISITDRVGETYKDGSYERKSLEYRVLFTKQTNIRLLGCNDGVKSYFKQEKSVDGIKYCFTVPSGFLVLRRNNQVFITGNCGKSSTIVFQALKMMKTGKFDQILFIKTPSTLGIDDLGALSTNEVKFDVHLEAMRSIFQSFMSKEKLEMEERLGRIEFKFPNWCGGETWDSKIVIIDENQWMTPEINKLVLERITDNSVVVVAGDAKQRYSTKWRKDGFSDLIERVTELDEDGVRVSNNELFHYVRLEHSENRRGDFSRFITENYDNLNMS